MQDIGTFYILNWAAWAPGVHSADAWQAWAYNPLPINIDEKLQTTLIPASIKRRCSEVTKIALHVSALATENQQIDYAVFGAQHGELQRCVSLFDYIYHQESLSPMAFAQSVHNTASGLYSIIHKQTHSMNAIAAGEQTFNLSLIDALVWLKLNPDHNVLVTVYDDYFPEAYKALDMGVNCRYAVSFVIGVNKPDDNQIKPIQCELSQTEAQIDDTHQDSPQALNFLVWYLSESTQPWIQPNKLTYFSCKKLL